MKPIKVRINSTGEVVEVRPYQTEKYDFMVCRSGGIMGELYMRSELTIIGDNELEFVSLVKRMREAQNRVDMLAGGEDIEFVDMLCIEQREAEREVDEYLKKMGV